MATKNVKNIRFYCLTGIPKRPMSHQVSKLEVYFRRTNAEGFSAKYPSISKKKFLTRSI